MGLQPAQILIIIDEAESLPKKNIFIRQVPTPTFNGHISLITKVKDEHDYTFTASGVTYRECAPLQFAS